MVSESWFDSLRRISWKSVSETDKAVIGILAYEVASLMSKVVSMWHCLSEKEIDRLREEIVNSVGVKKLVADDDDYLMDLAFNEIIENFGNVARSVARIGKRCTDPVYHRFENFIEDPILNYFEWLGWEYRWKKMERKVKKMERFVAVMLQLPQELEVLAELEQTLRRIGANAAFDRVKFLEFRQKVMWQRQEVRNLREMSPWVRSYDYVVRLLIRSLFTVLERIKHVFGINHMASVEGDRDCEHKYTDILSRSHSLSASMQSSVYLSENNLCGPFGKSVSKPALTSDKSRTNNRQQQYLLQSDTVHEALSHSKSKRLSHVGPFKGCMMGGGDSPILPGCKPTGGGSMRFYTVYMKNIEKTETTNSDSLSVNKKIYYKLSIFSSKHGLLNASPYTLGHAALALRYANVVKLIEKLASSPHMISLDARDDLYNMLPMTIKSALRARLKAYAKTASYDYDASLAEEWQLAMERILEWLAPLAHNMIRWQSERNFEKESVVSRTNVLLVQTFHFASRAKTEAAIMELLVGLNYICRIGREHNEKALPEFSGRRVYGDCLLKRREDIAYFVS
ncbi:hypothetical protein JRO89_XS12G0038600 [Xanthoceras sorbifolium]|uniref:Uncharacterized protein n=1 Tax=Xanthoceras sorbifolium TaxID=99658 RepID=A0ABQ8HAY7_9ROSI|nr:hypothetical protein JRO89_XS12G0038600 [Xanthoceras sorbifolium]